MSLPMLFGGAECGPANPLQGISKRFDQDRGVQQDHFGAARAGSSRDAFRTQHGPTGPDTEAARFFSSTTPAVPGLSTAFDLSALHTSLPAHQQQQFQAPAPASAATAAWAADFMSDLGVHHQQPLAVNSSQVQSLTSDNNTRTLHSPSPHMQNWSPMGFGMRGFVSQAPMQIQQQPQQTSNSTLSNQISWDQEFTAQEQQVATSTAEQQITETQEVSKAFVGDELARTAGQLLENLKHESNPKFQKSQFMGLMKQLRDGEVVVDGNKMVESDGQRNSSQINHADVKGKGRAIDPGLDWKNAAERGFLPTTSMSVNSPMVQEHQQQGEQQENELDAYFRQDNADYTSYWNDFNTRTAPSASASTAQQREWDTLQNDWDKFEATTTGIKAIVNYHFQDSNPYLLGDSSRTTRHHTMHTGLSVFESVLELEAAVQRNMSDARAWYELGVKQQENEREHKALLALQRAVELDPTHLPTWLALAISYTNDNNRQGAYDSIQEWVKKNERYVGVPMDQNLASEGLSMNERYARLVDHLIAMARSDTSGEIDADIQIALAVLLNTNEDYERAQDCFKTALAVRPDDWLLYNRVGATMANSGKAEEALQYYYKALELNPGYIRARFNLGISCINLRRYDEAAQHILDALHLQESDGTRDGNNPNDRGVTTTALWDSLKTVCLQMQRADLAQICDLRDLEEFRNHFHA